MSHVKITKSEKTKKTARRTNDDDAFGNKLALDKMSKRKRRKKEKRRNKRKTKRISRALVK